MVEFAFLVDILEFEKAEVVEARNGLEALIKVRQQHFDAAFLDIKMPEMDGIKALEEILKVAPDLPVIMISGHGDTQTAVECTKIGAFNFLTKPIELNLMLITLRNALEQRTLVGAARVLTSPIHIQEIVGESEAVLEVKKLTNHLSYAARQLLHDRFRLSLQGFLWPR